MLHPPFKYAEPLGKDEVKDEIDHAYDHQDRKGVVGRTNDFVILCHKLADIEGGCERGFLYNRDEFVSESGKNVLYRLGKYDLEHRGGGIETKAARRLCLSLVDSLDTRANDLGNVCRAVKYKGQRNTNKLFVLELVHRGDKNGDKECAYVKLEEHRGAANNLYDGVDYPFKYLYPADLDDGKHRTEKRTAYNGKKREENGRTETLYQKHIPVFDKNLAHILCKSD